VNRKAKPLLSAPAPDHLPVAEPAEPFVPPPNYWPAEQFHMSIDAFVNETIRQYAAEGFLFSKQTAVAVAHVLILDATPTAGAA
jgi:hypothetical protein